MRFKFYSIGLLVLLATQTAAGQSVYLQAENRPSEEELSHRMLTEEDRFMEQHAAEIVARRERYWQWDPSSREAYEASVADNRDRLARLIGAVDPRVSPDLEFIGKGPIGRTDRSSIYRVRWRVLEGIDGEGLLMEPASAAKGAVIALPDADQTPEQIAGMDDGADPWALRLAESGLKVLIPTLIDRSSTFSGSDSLAAVVTWHNAETVEAWTNQPHREWIYRQAFEVGRHPIGFEVQKILAAVDWFRERQSRSIAVAGYGEGGLLAFYAAAIDPRIDAALVSGYFGPREELWREPLYRNVWSLLRYFGDAEIASLIAPRPLVIEYSNVPNVTGPPEASGKVRDAAAPGRLATPSFAEVSGELERLHRFYPPAALIKPQVELVHDDGRAVGHGSARALSALLTSIDSTLTLQLDAGGVHRQPEPHDFDAQARQKRQVRQIEGHLQERILNSDRVRYAFVQGDRASSDEWDASMDIYRDYLWDEVLGRLPNPTIDPSAEMWKVFDEETWTGYEVVLQVYPGVMTFGILTVPKSLKSGERRPVVVTQHGAGSLPRYTIRPEPDGSRGSIYNSFSARLAERGFITFSPHNPSGSRLGFPFRQIERRGNPVGLSLFSFILANNQQILRWLSSLDYVDEERIAFYGLSWGGRTAIRVPALLKQYRLSITSGDFNDWVRKVTTVDFRNSYMFSGAFETYEWNLGHTFNHAELAGLIAPRPFMVESGYLDNVAADEWVGYEYAKVHRLYDLLGISDRTELEFFNGRHEINGKGTFEFLHRYLEWPEDLSD